MTAILVAIAVSQMPDLRPGQHVTVSASADSWIPGAASRDDYAKLILAIRNQDRMRIEAMFPDSIKLIPNGSKVEVIEVDRPRTGGNYIADPSPANVPAIVVRMPGKPAAEDPDRFWVPMIYLAAPGASPRALWAKFPVLKVETDPQVWQKVPEPRPGARMLLLDRTTRNVLVAKDLLSLEAMIKAMNAGDSVGIQNLARANRIMAVENSTPVLLLDYAPPFFPFHAIKVRILAGAYNDQSCWVPDQFAVKQVLRVAGWESPAEKRAKTKRRR
jgi:hypothetical protein